MCNLPDGGRKPHPRPVDWLGLGLMVVSLGALQGLLSLGDQDGWFSSRTIIVLALVTVLGVLFFVGRSLSASYPLVNLRLLKDRNLTIGSLGIGLYGLAMFGTMVILPIMLESLMHYEAFTVGLVMAPQGISTMLAMMLAGRLLGRGVNPRNIVLVGIVMGAFGTYLSTLYNLNISMAWIIWPGFIRGIGFGLIATPLFTLAFMTLNKSQQAEASGIFNLMRRLGGSVGVAIVSTVMTQETQVSWNQMGGFINPFNPALRQYLAATEMTQNPTTWQVLGKVVLYNQAHMRGMLDAFVLVFYGFLIMIPLILLLRKPTLNKI